MIHLAHALDRKAFPVHPGRTLDFGELFVVVNVNLGQERRLWMGR